MTILPGARLVAIGALIQMMGDSDAAATAKARHGRTAERAREAMQNARSRRGFDAILLHGPSPVTKSVRSHLNARKRHFIVNHAEPPGCGRCL